MATKFNKSYESSQELQKSHALGLGFPVVMCEDSGTVQVNWIVKECALLASLKYD